MFCGGSRVSIDFSRRRSISPDRSDHSCYTYKFLQSQHRRQKLSLGLGVCRFFARINGQWALPFVFLLAGRNVLVEWRKLKSLQESCCAVIYFSVSSKSVFHLSRCWSSDATSRSLGFSGSQSVLVNPISTLLRSSASMLASGLIHVPVYYKHFPESGSVLLNILLSSWAS